MSIYADEAALEEAYSKGEQQQELDAKDPFNEHIYEEIPECRHRVRPLPPIPEGGLGEAPTAAVTSKSIFTGATKYEILHYLQDARQRIEGQIGDFDSCAEEGELVPGGESSGLGIHRNAKLRVSAGSNLSDSSSSSTESTGEGGVLWRGPLEKLGRTAEVERNDSGVGSDSGHSGSAKAGETKEVVQVVVLSLKIFFLCILACLCFLSLSFRWCALTVSWQWWRGRRPSVPSVCCEEASARRSSPRSWRRRGSTGGT